MEDNALSWAQIEINNHFEKLINSVNIDIDKAIRKLNFKEDLSIIGLIDIDISCKSNDKISDNRWENNEKSR